MVLHEYSSLQLSQSTNAVWRGQCEWWRTQPLNAVTVGLVSLEAHRPHWPLSGNHQACRTQCAWCDGQMGCLSELPKHRPGTSFAFELTMLKFRMAAQTPDPKSAHLEHMEFPWRLPDDNTCQQDWHEDEMVSMKDSLSVLCGVVYLIYLPAWQTWGCFPSITEIMSWWINQYD